MSTIHPSLTTFRRGAAAALATAALAAGLAVAPVATAAPSAAPASKPYCGITWGSLDKRFPAGDTLPFANGLLTNIRSGRHGCFDRLVFDLAGGVSFRELSYRVGYVDEVADAASGEVTPLRGGARLEIIIGTWSYDFANGVPTYPQTDEAVDVTGYSTFRQVASLGSHEGYFQAGLGVRARLPFRVFVLQGPGAGARVVIDVAHRWS